MTLAVDAAQPATMWPKTSAKDGAITPCPAAVRRGLGIYMQLKIRKSLGVLALAATAVTSGSALAEDEKKPAGEAVGAGWSAEVAPGGNKCLALDDAQTATVKQVSDYFNALGVLKGAFVQTGADAKRQKGKFYVKRPGRFRFDYAPPLKQVIVSDGQNLAIQDLDLQNEDRVELDQTPFRLLLKKDVDLARDACIGEVQTAEDLVVLALEDRSPDTPGKIRLFLAAKPALELKEWVTTDAQGQQTRVELSDLDKTDDLKPDLFTITPVGLTRDQPK